MAEMTRRKCAFCPDDEPCAIMYIAEERNLAAHQNCLLFSSGFVELEEENPEDIDKRFVVASVVSEIKRGKRLLCNVCRKRGATIGCEVKSCRKSYHYFCALRNEASIETDEDQGLYRLFCPDHIQVKISSFYERIEFLKKCKQAGLLNEIFEEMLNTLRLAQEKLMDDNTSEAEYEKTVLSLFDCGLFENILRTAHSGTEGKIQELMNTRKSLDAQIQLLRDLKGIVLPVSEDNTSNSISE
ncbi:PHD finger protein 11 isoform X3 [Ahaetulla prasina]|uniref:PHD finger protein 11 isoform X3 n=1 Tax=Ahaetulla prasina TaxID=499056 RepID=UPI002648AB33|nr:PHD finger protein 11 isoform X3 [Ahaetulla prasina]